ncbi:MAG: glycosyltransferase family 2 protein [Anaerolineales bacterium]|nr:glycosyltransferase family 2 protein [Anaerolineales bacterium]
MDVSESSTRVSIIIPAYKGAKVIGDAIESVLRQNYGNFELLVVDDCSPDNTGEVVRTYAALDPRVRYIRQQVNGGADVARRTGLDLSTGDIVVFLDQDDQIHPDKLAAHVALLDEDPTLGVTYNSRFELNYSSATVREIFRPPERISLADLVLGFPIAPSDMVMRRTWAVAPEIWDDSFVTQGEEVIVNGGEMVFCGRLFMAGCKFGFVDRALNYRSHHAGRQLSDIALRCNSELRCQEIVFADPRCTDEVRAQRDQAFANTYCVWGYEALVQGELELGQDYFRRAHALRPEISAESHGPFLRWLVNESIVEYQQDHAIELAQVVNHLPDEYGGLGAELPWAVARGHLIKGTRAVMWDLPEGADRFFVAAVAAEAEADDSYYGMLSYQLLLYEKEMGAAATDQVIDRLAPYLQRLGGKRAMRRFRAAVAVDRAFVSYQKGSLEQVPSAVLRAVTNQPEYLFNRGVVSIFVRSLIGQRRDVAAPGVAEQSDRELERAL